MQNYLNLPTHHNLTLGASDIKVYRTRIYAWHLSSNLHPAYSSSDASQRCHPQTPSYPRTSPSSLEAALRDTREAGLARERGFAVGGPS